LLFILFYAIIYGMKLSAWAKKNGLTYKAAWRLFKTGQLPVPATQLKTGTILVYEPSDSLPARAALYARVSSHDQKADAERQMERLRAFAAAKGLPVAEEVIEIGSGLNGHRKKLLSLLANPAITVIVVEHKDRLARFGVELIAAALLASKRQIMVMNETEYVDDIVQDMTDVMTSFCARLYGKRGALNRALSALSHAKEG
jgi:predicted site-specific integrase-resolvase